MQNHMRAIFSGGGGASPLTAFIAAFVAAVLLAASAGTAEAQTVSFSATSGVVKEPAPVGAAPAPFTVTVTRSATSVTPVTFVTSPALTNTAYGNITIAPASAITSLTATGGTIVFPTGRNSVQLSFTQAADNNWKDEKFIIALRAPAGTRIGPDLVITTDDNHATPRMVFRTPGDRRERPIGTIQLTEDSVRDVELLGSIYYTPGSNYPNGELVTLTGAANNIRISVDPADALGKAILLTQAVATPVTIGTAHAVANKPGQYDLPLTIRQAAGFPRPTGGEIKFSVKALADTTGFRMPRVTLTALALDKGTSGVILASEPLVVEVLSDEAIPTVSFSPTDISIKEGGRTTSALIAEGPHGAEVNMVKLSVSGDAMVDLHKGATKLAPAADGMITMDLKDTNVARLTARSTSDRSLLDGQMKSKTWRITDADGAKIDPDANSFTVTVEGSTAVPALPLVAQLLLALFLTAGGARLYRRRR